MVTIFRCKKAGENVTTLFFQNRENAITHFCKVAHKYGHDINAEMHQKIKESYPYKCITINGTSDVFGEFAIELESRDYYDK